MTSDRVAVLGLGRMGAAMAERYSGAGWEVASWSRGGGGSHPTPADAAAQADAAVLALYDGRACQDVVAEVLGVLAERLLVNTATVGPGEAEALDGAVVAAGGRYVHAPVLGSVPAVREGALRVLAGGAPDDVAMAAEVLAPLAVEVRHVGDVRAAASAKLVANASLAGSALALRGALAGAAGLGLPLRDALDVLELGRLGDLVRASRARIESGDFAGAHFTVGAIAKDIGLLADASGSTALADRVRYTLDADPMPPDVDFIALAVPASYRTASAMSAAR